VLLSAARNARRQRRNMVSRELAVFLRSRRTQEKQTLFLAVAEFVVSLTASIIKPIIW